MALETTLNKKIFVGDDIVVAFAYPFLFLKNADLEVSIYDTVTKLTTLKTIITDYTVTGANDPDGGTVTFLVAPTSTEKPIVRRIVDLTQLSIYTDFNRFPSATIVGNYDNLTMMVQQLDERVMASLQFESIVDTTATSGLIEGDLVAGYVPRLKSDLTGMEWAQFVDSTSLSLPAGLAFMVQTASGVFTARTITKVGNIGLTNGSGLSGNPVIDSTNIDTSITATVALTLANTTAVANLNVVSKNYRDSIIMEVISVTQVKILGGITMRDVTNTYNMTQSSDLTIDITASGALGIDTGSEATTTDYAIVMVSKASDPTDTTYVLVDESVYPTIVFPTGGYDIKKRVGRVHNNGSGNLLIGLQVEEEFSYYEQSPTIGTITSSTWSDVATAPYTAKNSRMYRLQSRCSITGAVNGFLEYAQAGKSSGSGVECSAMHEESGSINYKVVNITPNVPCDGTSSRNTAFKETSSTTYTIRVVGYTDRLID